MTIEAMKQALEALEIEQGAHAYLQLGKADHIEEAITALCTAIEQAEKQEPVAWLTKELMADYLDMIAEAIEDNRSEALRHKAHWMRVRGEA
jgi:hypothetical protein